MIKKNRGINVGVRIISVLFILLFFVLCTRFLFLQAKKEIEGEELVKYALTQRQVEQTLQAHRGKIYDQNGMVLAEDMPTYTVFARLDEGYSKYFDKPMHVTSPEKAAEKLSPLLKMENDKLIRLMSKEGLFQVELGPEGRNISSRLMKEIEDLEIPGIDFIQDYDRFYPNGTFASHVLGYAKLNKKESQIVGEMGIEQMLDERLRGVDGVVQFLQDNYKQKLLSSNEEITAPKDGNNVYLTIDQKIQTFLEDAMNQAYKEYEPKKIIAIVANPKTGEILAMSNRPSFDPNIRDIENYMNDSISYRYEPGSTMKVFTLAAAIEEGVFNPDEMYESGSYQIGPNRIKDHNGRGWNKISLLEGMQRSSNVAFAILGYEKLGPDLLYEYIQKFGLDSKTNIDLPGEVNSNIVFRYPIEQITTAFGQGSAITPIQQIKAATAIANDGKMMEPYVIKKVVDSNTNEVIQETQPKIVGEPISSHTARQVREILESVVTSPNGTGKAYYIEGYDVAGKTGTAQIPNPDGPGYLYGHRNYIHSFLGMAPQTDPKLLVYVAVQQPQLENYEFGSEPVSMVFNTVMKNSLQYLNIAPVDKENTLVNKSEYSYVLENFKDKETNQAYQVLKNKKIKPVVLGDGKKIIAQLPYPEQHILPGERVVLLTESKEMTMPNLQGWSLRDVMKVVNLLNLKPNTVGRGFVIKQNIQPGTQVFPNDYLIVDLKSIRDTNNETGQIDDENTDDGQ